MALSTELSPELIDEIREHIPSTTDWRAVVSRVDGLPALPSITYHALQLIDDPNTTAQKLASAIQQDVGLTTRLLKLSNSALFSRTGSVSSVFQATSVLGFQSIRSLILAASLTQFACTNKELWKTIWSHSVGVGLMARYLARELKRKDPDEVFLCGLLHNLGQVVLVSSAPDQYKLVLDEIELSETEYHTAEEKIFGVANPILGALLLRRWNLPPHLARVILAYHGSDDRENEPDKSNDSKIDSIARIVRVADLSCHHAKIGTPPGYPANTDELVRLLPLLGLPDTTSTLQAIELLGTKAKSLFDNEFSLFH